jgi:hypothetical protein
MCGQVSARFWLMDCRNVAEATKMATNLYKEAIHVPFMSKFVVFSKRHEQLEVKLKTTISNYFFSNFLPANACSKKHVPSFL